MRDRTTRAGFQAGFTLVEALVALIILSVGLLGIAGLQIAGLKANKGSATRTQAVYLAYDIIDRARANPGDAINGNYNLAIDATPSGGTVAGDDLVAWRSNISNGLPTGSVKPSGSVNFDSGTKLFTVNIVWDDAHANITKDVHAITTTASATSDVVTFSMTTQLSN